MGANSIDAGAWTLVVKGNAIRLGLTGGIGSGKSTVAAMLQGLNASVIDADEISRRLTARQGAALPQIAATFGPAFIDANGALNRPKMRETVFNDSSAKTRLEGILHPLIREEMLVQANLACAQGAACVVLDIPLLVESGAWRNFIDLVLVVDCTASTQVSRVIARNGLSDAAVQSMMAAQLSREERLLAADIVLFNDDCSMEQLVSSVSAIAPKIGL